MLTEKTASLSTFQRTRGMLRLLARTVHHVWRTQPPDAYSLHTHHMDPGFEAIRTEVNVKLGQGQYAPAVKSDVAAVAGDELSLAQRLDEQKYPGLPPVTSYVARTIFWHTLAYGDSARGITAEQLKLSVCSPVLEPSFIEQARIQFVADSIYLDEREGEVAVVEHMRLLRAEGMSYRRIAAKLNAVGVQTRTAGKRWRSYTINSILSRL